MSADRVLKRLSTAMKWPCPFHDLRDTRMAFRSGAFLHQIIFIATIADRILAHLEPAPTTLVMGGTPSTSTSELLHEREHSVQLFFIAGS
jgi:pantothenate kinase type III